MIREFNHNGPLSRGPRQGNIASKGNGEHGDGVDALTERVEKTGRVAEENEARHLTVRE